MSLLFNGNAAIKQLVSEYGSEVASNIIIEQPTELISIINFYNGLSKIQPDSTLKGEYKGMADIAAACLKAKLQITAQALNAKVLLEIDHSSIYGSPSIDEMKEVSSRAKVTSELGTGVSIVETNVPETKEAKVIEMFPNKEIKVKSKEKKEEVKQPEEVVATFQPKAESIQQSDAIEDKNKEVENVLPITRKRILGVNENVPVAVINSFTKIEDLNSYFKTVIPNIITDEEERANLYMDIISDTPGFSDIAPKVYRRLQANEYGCYKQFSIVVLGKHPKIGKAKKVTDRLTFNDVITQTSELLKAGNLKEAKELADKQLRHVGVLNDNGKVMPHLSMLAFNKWFENLKDNCYKEANAEEQIVETANELVFETFESLVAYLTKLVKENQIGKAYETAQTVLTAKSIKHADGTESEIYTKEKAETLVNCIIKPGFSVEKPTIDVEKTVIIAESKDEEVSKIVENNTELEKTFFEKFKELGTKLEIGVITKLLKSNGIQNVNNMSAGVKARIYKHYKNLFQKEVKPATVETAVVINEQNTELFIRTNDIPEELKTVFDSVDSMDALEILVLQLLDKGAKWQDVLNSLLFYKGKENVIGELREFSEETTELWYTALLKSKVVKPVTNDIEVGNENIIEPKVTETVSPAQPEATQNEVPKNKIELRNRVVELIKENKEEEAANLVKAFWPKQSNSQTKTYIATVKNSITRKI
jgi:hypothetical protein